jgi:hypothetical protein
MVRRSVVGCQGQLTSSKFRHLTHLPNIFTTATSLGVSWSVSQDLLGAKKTRVQFRFLTISSHINPHLCKVILRQKREESFKLCNLFKSASIGKSHAYQLKRLVELSPQFNWPVLTNELWRIGWNCFTSTAQKVTCHILTSIWSQKDSKRLIPLGLWSNIIFSRSENHH